MQNIINQIREDSVIILGLAFLVFSLFIFGITANEYSVDNEVFTGMFFANFGITWIYYIVLISNYSGIIRHCI
jgi:hypothetical protein